MLWSFFNGLNQVESNITYSKMMNTFLKYLSKGNSLHALLPELFCKEWKNMSSLSHPIAQLGVDSG